jgi:hypothetical protein
MIHCEHCTLLIPETDDDSLTHWRRLTHSESRDWLTVVYCLPFITSGCPNGNTGLTTVGYHSNQHWPSHHWLLCNQHCWLPCTQQYRSGERIHGTIRPRLLGNQHSPTATRQYRVVSVSMELFDHGYVVTTRVLHSNDGLRSNTSHYLTAHTYVHLRTFHMFLRCFPPPPRRTALHSFKCYRLFHSSSYSYCFMPGPLPQPSLIELVPLAYSSTRLHGIICQKTVIFKYSAYPSLTMSLF